MFNISSLDLEFYSKEGTWSGGPIFELKLVFAERQNGQKLSEFLIQKFNLIVFEESSENNSDLDGDLEYALPIQGSASTPELEKLFIFQPFHSHNV